MSEIRKTVLLIDDEVISNVMHTLMLRRIPQVGHIHEVLNGKEALTYLEEALLNNIPLPDIIYLDINMPVMNGFEFIEKLIEHPLINHHELTIVMLTSSIHPKDITRAKALGIVHFFVKPLNESHIQQTIKIITG